MTASVTVISAAEAVSRFVQGEKPIILDGSLNLAQPQFDGDYRASSGRDAWLAERIPGAQHIDLLQQWIDPNAGYHFTAPRPDAFAEELGRAGIDGTRQIWLYDRGGSLWAARLWWTLRNAGISAVVIDGGLQGWRDADGPLVQGAPATATLPVPAPITRDLGMWVGRADVQQVLDGTSDDDSLLLCALSIDAMWGRVPTRYSRRGHIPGSLHLPGRALLGSHNSLLSGPTPSEILGIHLPADQPVILYCGGGITACLSALALVHHGAREVRVYDGSLEEWSANSELTLVRS